MTEQKLKTGFRSVMGMTGKMYLWRIYDPEKPSPPKATGWAYSNEEAEKDAALWRTHMLDKELTMDWEQRQEFVDVVRKQKSIEFEYGITTNATTATDRMTNAIEFSEYEMDIINNFHNMLVNKRAAMTKEEKELNQVIMDMVYHGKEK